MLIPNPDEVKAVKEELECSWQTADLEAHRRLALHQLASVYEKTSDRHTEILCDVLEWLINRA